MNCPNCGFPVDGRNLPRTCPKCDEDLIRAKARRPLQVDLAHAGETVETALRNWRLRGGIPPDCSTATREVGAVLLRLGAHLWRSFRARLFAQI